LGSVAATGSAVDLTSRPDSSYAGYPSLPVVTNPATQAVTVGENATFAVSASGGMAPLLYQWQENGADITDGGIYSGATTNTLTLTGVALADSGNQYRCVVNDFVWYEAVSNAATLTVNPADTTKPTVTDVTPSGTDADLGGNVVITFSEAMDTAAGTVSLDGGIGTLTGGSWTVSDTVYTVSYSNLDYSTTYTITIEDFKDVAGNVLDPNPDTSHSFTTKDQPDGPDVSPTTLNLDLNGNPTGTLTISLGQSGNQAAQADITVDPANTSDISVDTNSLVADGSVVVTGHRAVTGATLTVEFSGGDLAAPTSVSVTVNVTDSTPIAHTVTFDLAGGTHTGGGALSQTVADGGAATAPTTTRNGYTFNGWDKSFSNVTANMAVTAQWTQNSTGGSSSSSDSGGIDYTIAPAFKWYTKAELEAAIQNGSPARTRYSGSAGVKADLWKLFGQSSYMHDTTADGAVQVRVQFTNPSALGSDALLSGWVRGDAVNSIKGIFEKWFKSNIRVIHLEQQADWGQPVEVAAKLGLIGMDTANLFFYSYDKAANTYRCIENPAYWIDTNRYLHFTTEYAGDIIVSEWALERK